MIAILEDYTGHAVSDVSKRERAAGRSVAQRAVSIAIALMQDTDKKDWSHRVSFTKDPQGKPWVMIDGRRRDDVLVSISHSWPFVLGVCATARGALGADVERVRQFQPHTARAFMTAEERAAVASYPSTQQAYATTLCWSLKESMLKALGPGLRMHPRSVDVTKALTLSREGDAVLYVEGTPYQCHIWITKVGTTAVACAVVVANSL